MDHLIRAIFWQVIMSICAAHCVAQQAVELDSPIKSEFTSVRGDDIDDFCRIQNIPCGVEEIRCNDIQPAYEPKNQILVHFMKSTLREALNHILSQHPQYEWTKRNGVINLEPRKRVYPDFLSIRLPKLSIHGATTNKAMDIVFKQAGIETTMMGPGHPRIFVEINLDAVNITVRDALNAIAKMDGQVMWDFSPISNSMPEGCFYLSSWRTAGGESEAKDWGPSVPVP